MYSNKGGRKCRRINGTLRATGIGMLIAVAGCQGTPQLGSGGSLVTGSAGAAGAQKASRELIRCNQPLGRAAVAESDTDGIMPLPMFNLQSPVPLLRLIMAQSNCFTVVDRSVAVRLLQQEQILTGKQANFVSIDYLIVPNVIFSNQDAGGLEGLA